MSTEQIVINVKELLTNYHCLPGCQRIFQIYEIHGNFIECSHCHVKHHLSDESVQYLMEFAARNAAFNREWEEARKKRQEEETKGKKVLFHFDCVKGCGATYPVYQIHQDPSGGGSDAEITYFISCPFCYEICLLNDKPHLLQKTSV
jgi:hypothetical protein